MYTNERTALLFFSGDRVSGYYRDAAGEQYRVVGNVDRATRSVACTIVTDDADSERVGTLGYRARVNPKKASPIADGVLDFRGETYAVCVRPAHFANEKTGHTVFPDQMPMQTNAPF